jgi:hypothetical protein
VARAADELLRESGHERLRGSCRTKDDVVQAFRRPLPRKERPACHLPHVPVGSGTGQNEWSHFDTVSQDHPRVLRAAFVGIRPCIRHEILQICVR